MRSIPVAAPLCLLSMVLALGLSAPCWAQEAPGAGAPDEDPFAKEEIEQTAPPLADPIAPVNRGLFAFNDKLYFWVLKPVATGYSYVVPETARVGVGNFFRNAAMPIRMVNCLLQGSLKGTGIELARFGVNTTVGVAGFGDPARGWLKLHPRDEDFGQTLGVWGMGQVCYITWPVIGPSSLRDTIAWPVNAVLDPLTYVPGVGLLRTVNDTSLRLGDYEELKANALDPYIALRDAYNQHRRHAVYTRK